MFLELFVGAVILVFVWDYFHKKGRNDVFKMSGLKGPPTIPVLGNALDIAKYRPETLFDFIREQHLKYGKNFRLWLLHEAFYVTSDPIDFESILSSQQLITRTKYYDFLKPWLGRSLILSTGPEWHTRRKIVAPTFHFKILATFVEIFDQQSAILMKRLADRADGATVIDIYPEACPAALDIIAETAMGVKVEAQQNPDLEYARAAKTIAEIVPTQIMRINRRFSWLFCLTAHTDYQALKNAIQTMHQFTDKVISEREAALAQSERGATFSTVDMDGIGNKKRMAFLDVLLESSQNGKSISNKDIREEVDTFMFAGHDSIKSNFSFTCYLIARHPEVQQKLFEEIREIIGDDRHKPITMRELQELKYLECVIKESLRLYPPFPIIGRITNEDVELNGRMLPANTNIVLVFFEALRDPDYFPNPEKFMPERFSLENIDKISPFAYVPFSAGPRNCVGQKFAMLEMKSIVSKILRCFELLPLGVEVQPVMNIILTSSTGINLGLKPRIYE